MPTKYKLEAQAKEEFVIVKRAVKGRIHHSAYAKLTKAVRQG